MSGDPFSWSMVVPTEARDSARLATYCAIPHHEKDENDK